MWPNCDKLEKVHNQYLTASLPVELNNLPQSPVCQMGMTPSSPQRLLTDSMTRSVQVVQKQYAWAQCMHYSYIFKSRRKCSTGQFPRTKLEIKIPNAGTSLVAQWLIRLCAPSAEGPGSIPGQGTKSHVQQLRARMQQLKTPYVAMKIPCAATKAQCNPINKY